MLKKRKGLTCISLLLLVIFIFSWSSALEAATYKDKAALWPEAWQAIGELSAGDVVKGYQDGYFKPDSEVTKLETVALLIRIIGKEDQAKAMEKATVSYKVPANLFWGRGYLIAAAEQGMLVKEHLYQLAPSEPATRAEVAVLVYHALKLSPTGATLNFSDAGEIPEAYRDFVASVVQNKIMVGLPGNVFKPNDHITRAQMTVLLSRLIDNGKANPYPNRWMRGTLAEYSSSAGTITIKLGSYAVIDKTLAGDCQVFSGGNATTIGAVSPGAELKLVLNGDGRVAFISVSSGGQATPGSLDSRQGRVRSVWLSKGEYYISIVDPEGRSVTYKVEPDASVYQDGVQKDFSTLQEDMYVSYKVAAGLVSGVSILDTEQVQGKVISATSSQLKIEKSSGDQLSFVVPQGVVVEKDGSNKNIDDLVKGNQVKVTVYDDKAIIIEIVSGSSGDISGEIRSIDSSGTFHITIRDDDGNTREYQVDDSVDVYRDGDRIDFDELNEGEQVSLELDSDDVVTRIETMEDKNTLSGKIKDIDSSGTFHITIEDKNGDYQEYKVDSDVDVYRDGDRIDFEDLDEGEDVSIELDSRDVVTRIEVSKDEEKSCGVIRSVDKSGTLHITIRNDGGYDKQYEVKDDADVYRNNEKVTYESLNTGEYVCLDFNYRDQVLRIEVTEEGDSIVNGTVTDLSTGSSPRIQVKKSGGSESRYYIADNARYYNNSERINLSDIQIGSEVKLTLENGEVTKIDIIDEEDITVMGEITAISTSRERLTIRQDSGNIFSYYLGSSSRLRDEDGGTIDLNDLEEGWEVEIELRSGDIYRLDVTNK
ncbi:MAG: S-layer homology domain-containing protein [Eubacteriales bacterium]